MKYYLPPIEQLGEKIKLGKAKPEIPKIKIAEESKIKIRESTIPLVSKKKTKGTLPLTETPQKQILEEELSLSGQKVPSDNIISQPETLPLLVTVV